MVELTDAEAIEVRLQDFMQSWTTAHGALRGLLKRYLQNHCEAADREGMSVLCECKLCLDTRKALAPQ